MYPCDDIRTSAGAGSLHVPLKDSVRIKDVKSEIRDTQMRSAYILGHPRTPFTTTSRGAIGQSCWTVRNCDLIEQNVFNPFCWKWIPFCSKERKM